MKLIDYLIIFTWLIVPYLCSLILKMGGMRFWQLSLPQFAIASIFALQYLGLPILYFELDDYRSEFITNKNLLIEVWLITSSTTILFCLGALAGRLMFGQLNHINFYSTRSKIKFYSIRRTYAIGLFCTMIMYLYIDKIGFSNLAIIVALKGSTQEIATSRSLMGNDFNGAIHWYNLFMRDVLIFISLAIFAMKIMKASNISNTATIATFLIVMFSLTMSSEKGLFADYIIAILLLFIITKKKGYLQLKFIVMGIISLVLFLVPSYIYFMGDPDIITGIFSIISRGLTGSIQPAYHYLEFFPNYNNWLYGTSLPNPGGILPFQSYNLTLEVKNFVDQYKTSSVVGSMPAIYWGEIYANFGYAGLIIAPPIIGFILYGLNSIIFRLQINPPNAALFCWLLIHYKNLSITSISMYLVDTNLYMIILIYIIITTKLKKPQQKLLNQLN